MIFGEIMKMYNLFVLSVLVLFALQQSHQVSAQTDALSIANLGVSPQPVVAGNNVTIQFQLYNSYQNQLTNVNLGLYGSYPILNTSPAYTQLISNIPTGIYGGTSYLFYTIHIPKSAQSGTYTIDAIAKYQTSGTTSTEVSGTSTMPISFYVQGIPNVQLTANPSSAVTPGSQLGVVISAINIGTDNATNVTLSISNSRNFSVIGASNFALGTIEPQKTSTASAILQPNSTLSQGNSSISVTLRYDTESGKPVVESVQVPVSIFISNPDVSVSVLNSNPAALYPGSNQTLTLSIQNIGSGLAKNVTVHINSDNNITVGNSASNLFIGSLAAGASTTSSVLITANKGDNLMQYSLPIYLTYDTANYQSEINRTELLPIQLQPSAIFNITGINESLTAGSTYAPITLHVRNIGNQAAQHVVFSIQTIYPISQVTPNAYVTQLNPGQSANITFYVSVDSQASIGQYPITLYEQWNQQSSTSQQYSSSQSYYAAVTGGSSGIFIYIIVVVVVIAAVVVIRRRMSKQSAAKKKSS